MIKDFLDNVNNNKDAYKYGIVGITFFGLLSQGYGIFNKLSWHDDSGLFSIGKTYALGSFFFTKNI